MRKALCLLNPYSQQEGPRYFYERMAEELRKLAVELVLKSSDEVVSSIASDGQVDSIPLDGYAFCLYLDKDQYTSRLLEKKGLRLFNNSESIRLCDDKMLTHIALSQSNIPMPKTISAPLNYVGDLDISFLDKVADALSFPLVAKINFGSLGNGVFLIKSKDELIQFERQAILRPHLYQRFIESSFGIDYRLIIIGGKFIAGMRRHNTSGDFRSNIAQGGVGEKAKIPESFKELAIKAARILKLDYCGVDILIDEDGNPLICEVNSNAFIKGIEETTGINVAKAYASHIIHNL